MDGQQFDELTKRFASGLSRRRVLGGIGGLTAGIWGLAEHHSASAFLCRQPGVLCAYDAHCCSDQCDIGGTWRCLCPDPSQKLCGRVCADCCNDGDCVPSDFCQAGTCVSRCIATGNSGCDVDHPCCDGGSACCAGTCVNVLGTDPNHCGDCITVCPSGIGCSGGTCQLLQAGSLCESNEQCASGNCSPYALCSNPPTCTEYTDYLYCYNP